MFDQSELDAFKRNYEKSSSQKKKVGGIRGFLANAAPIVGGTLGAIGGSLVAPVAGTAAGGAAGAGLGSVIKQKLLGEDFDLGEIGKEAAFGALPGVGKLAKGAVGATKALKAGEDISQGGRAAVQTGKVTGKPSSLTQKTGQRLTEAGSGLKAGNEVGDVAKLDEQAQFMSRYVGAPRKQRELMEADMTRLSKEVDDALSKNSTRIQPKDITGKLQSVIDNPNTFNDLDITSPRTKTLLEKNMQILGTKTDAKQLNDYVKTLNKTATSARDKLASQAGRSLTPNETAALATKRIVDDALKSVPEIASQKRDMAMIFEVTPQIAKAGEKSIGVPFAQGVNVKAPVQAVKGAQSRVGSLLQGRGAQTTGELADPSAFRPSQLLKMGAVQTGSQMVGDALTAPIPEEQGLPLTENDPQDLSTLEPQAMPEEPQSIWSDPQQVQEAYTRAIMAGDKQAAALILQGYETFGQSQAASTKPLSAEASKIVSNAQTGLQAIQDLESAEASDPNVLSKRIIPGRGAFGGALGNALGTTGADAAVGQIVDIIARLRTGAAITNDEAKRFESMVPQAFDPPETRAQKLNYLRNQFQMVASRSGTAGNDTQQLIEQGGSL